MTITAARVALGATAFAVPAATAVGLTQLDPPKDDPGSSPFVAFTLAGGVATMGIGASTMLHGPLRAYTLLTGAGLALGGLTGSSING